MRVIKPLIYFFLFALILSSSGGLAHAKNNKYKMKFTNMDSNHDGVITLVEWRGNNQSFQNQDWDGDGVLSGDEVRVGAQRSNYYDKNDKSFSNLDYNRDNIVSRSEWRGDIHTFERIDCNRNSQLTRDEFLSQTECNTTVSNGTFRNLDNNNDGYLSRNEWRESNQGFINKDCNRDDRMSRVEFITQNCSSKTCDITCLVRELDSNNDGFIYRNEWQGSSQTFNQLDQNRDNRLDRNEISYVNQSSQGKTQQVLGSVSSILDTIFTNQ